MKQVARFIFLRATQVKSHLFLFPSPVLSWGKKPFATSVCQLAVVCRKHLRRLSRPSFVTFRSHFPAEGDVWCYVLVTVCSIHSTSFSQCISLPVSESFVYSLQVPLHTLPRPLFHVFAVLIIDSLHRVIGGFIRALSRIHPSVHLSISHSRTHPAIHPFIGCI